MSRRYVYCGACCASCPRTEFVYVGEGSIVTRKKVHAEAVVLKHRTCQHLCVQVYRESVREVA